MACARIASSSAGGFAIEADDGAEAEAVEEEPGKGMATAAEEAAGFFLVRFCSLQAGLGQYPEPAPR